MSDFGVFLASRADANKVKSQQCANKMKLSELLI